MGQLVWQKSIPDYLCFTALEAGTFTLTIPAAVTATYLSYVEWSKDGRTWNHTDNTSEAVTIQVDVAQGEKVYWRGSGSCTSSRTSTQANASTFASTAEFDVSGHIMSLLKGNNFADYESLTNYTTDGIYNYTFYGLFYGNQKVVNAADLVLPTFTSYHIRIFSNLFYGCTSLVSAPLLPNLVMSEYGYASMFRNTAIATPPALPATTLANACYYAMFYNCQQLTTAPTLPATTLVNNCYTFMFAYCSSLTSAPDLNAATLMNYCYDRMFQNCSRITYVKCLATDISATNCLQNWLNGVSSTGTFIQAEGVEWPRGASGIPTGWVDVEKRTMPQGYKQVLYVDNEHNSVQGAAYMSIGYPVNMKYDTIEIAFQQDTISDGMPIQSVANVAGNAWFYNYYNSSQHPFSIYVTNESGTQRGGVVYKPLDTDPHVVRFAADGTYGVVTHNGEVVIFKYQVGDLPETCASNTLLFGSTIYTTYRGKIFYFKNWNKDNNVLADYVPCVRESDGKVGFYDFASNSYKTHTQAGDWTAGEEI